MREWLSHQYALRRRAKYFVGSDFNAVDDLLQETFLRCHRFPESFQPDQAKFFTWARSIMSHVWYDMHKRVNDRWRDRGRAPLDGITLSVAPVAEDRVLCAEIAAIMDRELTPRQRQVMRLAAREIPLIDIDDMLGLKRGNAKVHALDARKRLRAAMGESNAGIREKSQRKRQERGIGEGVASGGHDQPHARQEQRADDPRQRILAPC